MKKQTAIILLVIVTIIWGGSFVATKMVIDNGMTAGVLNIIRGFVFAMLVFLFFPKQVCSMKKPQIINGLLVGVFNAVSFILQAQGAMYTTPSNSSFLSTTNVVMVPFLAWIIIKIKPKIQNILAVVVCMIGMAVLTGALQSEFVVNIGDVYTIISAFFFALAIVLLAKQPTGGHFAANAFLMGITLCIGGIIYTLFIEKPNIANIQWSNVIMPIIYLSVLSNFVAQSLQIVAQRYLSASTASLVMMLEGVFGSIFSIMFGYEFFTINLLVGGGLILLSLILSEMTPVKQK